MEQLTSAELAKYIDACEVFLLNREHGIVGPIVITHLRSLIVDLKCEQSERDAQLAHVNPASP